MEKREEVHALVCGVYIGTEHTKVGIAYFLAG